ncbi:HDIG domain-containing protein [Rhodocytophaga rosea]|uniref:HDIG domain-containing protein n=1 Tax=Rhodocytophaga rosea TaxID=2704465 RepID=A0A6C0GUC5_9BACT|nr:AAA family ATPase [Rhodocytophaga rosea]QHT71153.1 HDIG domain-containing protein [Rhodocytophaga rosea]
MSGKLLADYPVVQDYREYFDAMKSTMQDRIHHQEGDVYTHTEMVLNALLNLEEYKHLSRYEKLILEYTTLFHDIAKPATYTLLDDNRITHPRHGSMGANIARQILDKENYKFHFISAVYYTVLFHGYPFWLFQKENPFRTVITTSLLTSNKLLYIFAKADLLGRVCGDAEDMLYKLELFKEYCLDHDCYDTPKSFASDYDRFYYFNVNDSYPDTELYHQYAFNIYMMSGLPASGKDSYIHRRWGGELPIISLDDIREELDIAPTDNQGRVIRLAKEKSKEYCRKKQSFIWNATNISRNMRSQLIDTWLPYHPKINIIFLFKNINQVLIDNAGREKEFKISSSKILAMHQKVQFPTEMECHNLEVVL